MVSTFFPAEQKLHPHVLFDHVIRGQAIRPFEPVAVSFDDLIRHGAEKFDRLFSIHERDVMWIAEIELGESLKPGIEWNCLAPVEPPAATAHTDFRFGVLASFNFAS